MGSYLALVNGSTTDPDWEHSRLPWMGLVGSGCPIGEAWHCTSTAQVGENLNQPDRDREAIVPRSGPS